MIYNEHTINAIRDIVLEKNETIAVAESVTAGHLQAAFSSAIDASKFFQGGITAYNIGQKARHLSIDPILGGKVNCVHQRIAVQMAASVMQMFTSDYGIAITGYASIVPECEKEGLFAFFAIAHNGKIVKQGRLSSPEKIPWQVQIDYAKKLIAEFHQYLTSSQ